MKPTGGNIRIKVENITEEIPLQKQHNISQSQTENIVTNEHRSRAELFSVRSEYSETFLQLQNEKKNDKFLEIGEIVTCWSNKHFKRKYDVIAAGK